MNEENFTFLVQKAGERLENRKIDDRLSYLQNLRATRDNPY
jgi:hypothetical protein